MTAKQPHVERAPATAEDGREDHRRREPRLPLRARAGVRRSLGPGAADAPRGDASCSCTPTKASPVSPRAATGFPTARCSSTISSGSTRCARRRCARSARRWTSTAAGPGRSRWRSGISSARPSAQPVWKLLGGRSERLLAYASSGELVAADERVERCLALATRGVRAVKIRFHLADWRDDLAVVEAVRDAVDDRLEIMVDANQGWRMPGDREPRWDVATAMQCARALEELGVYWLEEPLRDGRRRGLRGACAAAPSIRVAAGEMVRAASEARDLVAARPGRRPAGATSSSSGGSAAAGGSRRSATCTAEPGRRTRGRTATAWSPTSTVRSRSRRFRSSRCRTTRPPGRQSAATGCCPRRSRSHPTERSRRPQGRGSASTSTSTRSSAGGSAERSGPPCFDTPGAPVTVEDVELDPPKAGEVLVRVVAAGVCHSDVRLRGRRARRRGTGRASSATRAPGWSRRSATASPTSRPGTALPSASCRPAAVAGTASPASRTCACSSPSTARRACSWTARAACGSRTGRRSSTGCAPPASPSAPWSQRAGAVPIPDGLPLWQAALLGCSVVTGMGAVRNVAKVRPGDSVAVIGCGGVGLQVVAAARLAGCRSDHRRRPRAREARARPPPGRDARGRRCGRGAPTDAIHAVTDGGADYAFEVIGRPETIRLAWDAIRPGGSAVVVGLVPDGVDATVPAIEFLSDKSLLGTYYGSGDPAVEIPAARGAGARRRPRPRPRRHAHRGPRRRRGGARPATPRRGRAYHRRHRCRPRGRTRASRGRSTMTAIEEGPRTVGDVVADLDIRAQAFIDGEYVDAVSGETFACVSPVTGETIAQVAAGDAADVDRAVAGARAAFESGAVVTAGAEEAQEGPDAASPSSCATTPTSSPCSRRSTWASRSAMPQHVDIPLAAECIRTTARRSTRSTTRSPRRPRRRS